jgi:predicted permease
MNPFRKFRALFRREKLDAEMSEEMRAHLDLQVAENESRGMSPEEARHAALRAFGGVEQIKERARDQRAFGWIEQIRQDLRYAVRAIGKTRSFALTVVLTLALGLGANAALFSLYNAIALRPLPVKGPDELVIMRRAGGSPVRLSYPAYLAYRDGNRTFAGLAAWFDTPMKLADAPDAPLAPIFEVQGRGLAARHGFVPVQAVSENYFSVLGADIALGRGFSPEENRAPGGPPVIVLQHVFWQRHFHGDPAVLGKILLLNGRPHAVIGVTAPGFAGHDPAPPIGWVPLMAAMTPEALTSERTTWFSLIGRLAPGIALSQAQADLKLIADRLARTPEERRWTPPLDRGMKFFSLPLDRETLPVFAPIVVGFLMVLAIACTNVTNLLLARGVTRQQEIGVRLTLGASRGRIIRQLLTENLLLVGCAAIVGLVLAYWGLGYALSRLPAGWGRPGEMRQWQFLALGVDYRVAAFTLTLVVATTLAVGLLPALQASRADLISAVKDSGSLFGRQVGRSWFRSFLVVAQMAVCLTLLSCAGLLGRNMMALRRLDLGFDSRRVFEAALGSKGSWPAEAGARSSARRRALEEVRTLPGVVSACEVAGGPVIGRGPRTPVTVRHAGGDALPLPTHYFLVSGGFFETLGLPAPRGRSFTAREVENGAALVVINETAAQRFWPGEVALGQTLLLPEGAFTWSPGASRAWRECRVIGVVRDLRGPLHERAEPVLYLPLAPGAADYPAVLVRPRSDSAAALSDLAQAASALGWELHLLDRLSSRAEEQLAPFVVLGWVSGALGALALVMAAVGLSGIMAFAVNQRVREIGIRVALGATAARVVRQFVRQGMRLVALGLALGLVGGALVALALRKLMFGLEGAFDPVALAGVTAILAAAALLACWLPARRAAKVDPLIALRAE